MVLDRTLGAEMHRVFLDDLGHAQEIGIEAFRARPWLATPRGARRQLVDPAALKRGSSSRCSTSDGPRCLSRVRASGA